MEIYNTLKKEEKTKIETNAKSFLPLNWLFFESSVGPLMDVEARWKPRCLSGWSLRIYRNTTIVSSSLRSTVAPIVDARTPTHLWNQDRCVHYDLESFRLVMKTIQRCGHYHEHLTRATCKIHKNFIFRIGQSTRIIAVKSFKNRSKDKALVLASAISSRATSIEVFFFSHLMDRKIFSEIKRLETLYKYLE